MICENVLRYIKINSDGSVYAVYHKTKNDKPIRLLYPADGEQPETAVSQEAKT